MNKSVQIIHKDSESSDKERVINFISSLTFDDDKPIQVSFGEYKTSKTLKQLGYFFSAVIPACMNWQGLTELEADTFLKENCCRPFFKEILGKTYEVRKSIAKMKVKEMADYIAACIDFLGFNGVYVAPPTWNKGDI